MKSIRQYLLVSLMIALTIGTCLIGAAIYINTKHETDELFDEHLRQVSRVVLTQEDNLFSDPEAKPHIRSVAHKLKGEEEFLIQVWNKSDQLVYSSHPNVAFPLYSGPSVKDAEFEDKRWKTYISSSDNWRVQVSQPYQARREMIAEIGMNNLIPIIIQIPLLGLLFWIAIGRSMQPLDRLSAVVGSKVPGHLQPIVLDYVPIEVKPLVNELNGMMAREHDVLQKQQHFTSDAAHELRTPLAAIQLQADLLARSTTPEERQSASARLRSGIERAAHLVNQLLTLARSENSVALNRSLIDIAPIIQEIISVQAPLAAAKNLELKTNFDDSCKAAVDKFSLGTAINSLVDNAICYTPKGGRVAVSLTEEKNHIIIRISDNGCGIPEAELQRVFDRFYRISGSSGTGTGLGLAIAKSIIVQHGGTIEIKNNAPDPGITVAVAL